MKEQGLACRSSVRVVISAKELLARPMVFLWPMGMLEAFRSCSSV